jgi:hypothetical protein
VQPTSSRRRSPRSNPGGTFGGAFACLLVLLISWNAPLTNCKGGPIRSGIDHYELKIFEMRQIGSSLGNPIYMRSTSLSTTSTSINVDPPLGGVVGWDNMWSGTWTMQPPPIVTVSRAGARSDQPCP